MPLTRGVSGGAVKYVSAAIHTFLATKKISSVLEVRQIFFILDSARDEKCSGPTGVLFVKNRYIAAYISI